MAAPRGNLFAVGNNGGRPPKYDTPEAIEIKIGEYLDYEDSQKKPDAYSKMGKGIYTIEGCALFLGFAHVQSMYDYEKRTEEFSYVVNRFRLFLSHWNAQKLYWGGTFTGAQFWLRNHGGYSDESTVNQNQRLTKVEIEVVKSDAPLSNNENDVDV